MNPDLDPITFKRLQDFGRRRARLRLLRAASATACLVTAAITVAVMIDAQWLLTTWQRWVLSACVYGVIFAALWTWCRPCLVHLASMEDVAKAFEHADCRLQDHLLAAVELAVDDPICTASSPAFRAKLQQQVAKEIASSDVALLLPWQLIRLWVVLGVATVMVVTVLSCLPSLHFPQRIARTLLPAANLARHSRISLQVVQPQPQSQTVALGDMIRLVVEQRGPKPTTIFVQLRCDQQPLRSQSMHLNEQRSAPDAEAYPISTRHPQGRLYYTHLAIDSTITEYRVVADDATTAWYRLDALARPQALAFNKTLIFPTYMQRPDEHIDSDDGHLEAYAGSTVRLTVRCDQPLAQAEMRWQSTDSVSGQALSTVSNFDVQDEIATIEFPLTHDGSYRLNLKAKQSGFTNTFSPQYSARVLVDHPPKIHWTIPDRQSLIVKSDTILDLTVHVEDELPLSQVLHLVRINSGEWLDNNLVVPSVPSSDLTWKYDLAPLRLKPGDLVQTKLAAIDRKGQSTETIPLELIVSNADLIAPPHDRLVIRRAVADQLRQLAENCDRLHAALREQQAKDAQENSTGIASSRFAKEAEQAALELQEESRMVRQSVLSAISKLKDSVSLSELEGVVHVLSSLEHEQLRQLLSDSQFQLPSVGVDGIAKAQEQQREILTMVERIQKVANQLDQRFRQFHTHDILAAIGRDLALLIDSQRSLVNRHKDLSEEQIRREQSVLGRHFRELERLMISQLPILDGSPARQLEQWSLWFANHAEFIEQGTIERSSKERLDRLAATILQQLTLRPRISTIDVQLPAQLAIGHRELAALGSMLLAKLRTTAPPLALIADRRQAHQQRIDADRVFVSDLGNAVRAFKELMSGEQESAPSTATRLGELTQALGALEAIHEVREASQFLAVLLNAERWETGDIDSILENPRQWDGVTHAIDRGSASMRAAGVAKELVGQLEQIKQIPAYASASQTIASRRWSTEPARSAAADLEKIARTMAELLRKLEPIANQARSVIASYAPKLSTLAERAAESTRQLHNETQRLAEGLRSSEVPNSQQRIEQLRGQQNVATLPMAELREALQDLAGAQDLLDRQRLELARDADSAASIVQEAENRMQDAMQSAVDQSESPLAAAEKLAEVARQQNEASDALEQIAKHFGNASESSSDQSLAKQQAEWQHLLQRMQSDATMHEDYSQAERLAEMAETKPQTLLEKLEAEAKTNLPMREELSDIARAAAEESLRMLEQAANQERALRIALEPSDPTFMGAKDLLHYALSAATDQTSQTLETLISEAGSAATHVHDENIKARLEEIQQRVKDALTQANLVKDQHVLEEIAVTAKNHAGVLRDFQQALQSVAAELRSASQVSMYSSEQELKNRRREIEERQRRVRILEARDAQQAIRADEQRFNQNENALRNAKQTRERLIAQLGALEKQEQPDANELTRVQRAVKQSDEHLSIAEANRRVLQGQIDAATAAKRELDNSKEAMDFDAPNPTAQLASQLAERAAQNIDRIAAALAQQVDSSVPHDSLRASANRLAASLEQQRNVEQSVIEAGQNLARASRHEERVEHSTRQIQLARHSDQVTATANHELRQAGDKLSQSATQAMANVDDPFSRATPQSTQESKQSLQRAEDMLRKRADELGALLAAGSPQTSQEPSGAEQPTGENADDGSNSPMDASRMARMLDELDRQLNDQPGEPSSNQAGPTNSTQTSPSTSLAQAAQQLAAKMSQQRQSKNTQSAESGSETSLSRASSNPAPVTTVQLLQVNRLDKSDWGKLRQQTAEDIVESARESVAPRYRKQVETYFRVLAEQGLDRRTHEGSQK